MKKKVEKPFRINNCFKDGRLKDHSLLKIDKYNTIWIWFRDLERWVNAPQENGMQGRMWLQIEKYGVVYKEKK